MRYWRHIRHGFSYHHYHCLLSNMNKLQHKYHLSPTKFQIRQNSINTTKRLPAKSVNAFGFLDYPQKMESFSPSLPVSHLRAKTFWEEPICLLINENLRYYQPLHFPHKSYFFLFLRYFCMPQNLCMLLWNYYWCNNFSRKVFNFRKFYFSTNVGRRKHKSTKLRLEHTNPSALEN